MIILKTGGWKEINMCEFAWGTWTARAPGRLVQQCACSLTARRVQGECAGGAEDPMAGAGQHGKRCSCGLRSGSWVWSCGPMLRTEASETDTDTALGGWVQAVAGGGGGSSRVTWGVTHAQCERV